MSDTNPTVEQAVDALRDRYRDLASDHEIALGRVAALEARIDEVRQTIDTLTRGARPKRGRPRGSTNSAVPPATQPGGSDDSASLGEAQGVLT